MKRWGLLKATWLFDVSTVFDLPGFPAAVAAAEIARGLMGSDCSSHRLSVAAVDAHKVQRGLRGLTCQRRADKETAASHVEEAFDTVAAGLVAHSPAAAGLCRNFRHPQSCLEREKVLKGRVRKIGEGVVGYIHQGSVGYKPLIAGLPTSGHNI